MSSSIPSSYQNIETIHSKDNQLIKKLRSLIAESRASKSVGELWLEGEHLCSAAFDKGVEVQHLICAASYLPELVTRYPKWLQSSKKISLLQDDLFYKLSPLPSPSLVGFLVNIPRSEKVNSEIPTVVLDRVQDAGNVGSVLRSASAFGFKQIIALKGTANLWSNKVVRSGMGAHFGLNLIETDSLDEIKSLAVPLLCTSSHVGIFLNELQSIHQLPHPCAWVFGHEGQGVSQELLDLAKIRVMIAQPGGEESLNVAAACAICLYASSAVRA